MTQELPDTKYLDEAARAAGARSWDYADQMWKGSSRRSVIAHARTLARLAELEAENAWRPIGELPEEWKDGRSVDLWLVWSDKQERAADAFWNDERQNWQVDGFTLDQYMDKAVRATHFRPLSTPPKGDGA